MPTDLSKDVKDLQKWQKQAILKFESFESDLLALEH
jgi:hypothetical protein